MAKEISFPVGHVKLDMYYLAIRKRVPEFKIYKKRTSAKMWAMYIFSFMWIWNRRFMRDFTTTGRRAVYLCDSLVNEKNWVSIYKTLRHEFVHLMQIEKHGIFFSLGYIFPQVIAISSLGALGAIWGSNWFLVLLVNLVFLAPLPASYRKAWEVEGYTQTMLVEYEEKGVLSDQMVDWVCSHFTGPGYYWMWPFKNSISVEIRAIADDIRSGKIHGEFCSY